MNLTWRPCLPAPPFPIPTYAGHKTKNNVGSSGRCPHCYPSWTAWPGIPACLPPPSVFLSCCPVPPAPRDDQAMPPAMLPPTHGLWPCPPDMHTCQCLGHTPTQPHVPDSMGPLPTCPRSQSRLHRARGDKAMRRLMPMPAQLAAVPPRPCFALPMWPMPCQLPPFHPLTCRTCCRPLHASFSSIPPPHACFLWLWCPIPASPCLGHHAPHPSPPGRAIRLSWRP